MAARRFFTTASAACFSATNSTFIFAAIAAARRFAIVWDLPVPGGPSRTKERPSTAQRIASSWDSSDSTGHMSSSGAGTSACPDSLRAGSLNVSLALPTRWATTGFSRNNSQWSLRSCQIRNLAKLRRARYACSSTTTSLMRALASAVRMFEKRRGTSMPASSNSGRARSSRMIPWVARSFSSRQWLGMNSAFSSRLIRNAESALPVILTGIRKSGAAPCARLLADPRVLSVQRRVPMVR